MTLSRAQRWPRYHVQTCALPIFRCIVGRSAPEAGSARERSAGQSEGLFPRTSGPVHPRLGGWRLTHPFYHVVRGTPKRSGPPINSRRSSSWQAQPAGWDPADRTDRTLSDRTRLPPAIPRSTRFPMIPPGTQRSGHGAGEVAPFRCGNRMNIDLYRAALLRGSRALSLRSLHASPRCKFQVSRFTMAAREKPAFSLR